MRQHAPRRGLAARAAAQRQPGGDREPQDAVVRRRRQALHRGVEPARRQRRDAPGDAAVDLVDRVDHLQEPLHRADPRAAWITARLPGECVRPHRLRPSLGAAALTHGDVTSGKRPLTVVPRGPVHRLGWDTCSGGSSVSRPSSGSRAPSTVSGACPRTRWRATCSAGSCPGAGRRTCSCATAPGSTWTWAATPSTPPRSATRWTSSWRTTRPASGSSKTSWSTPSGGWSTRASAATSTCSRTTPTPRATPTAATRTTSSPGPGSSPGSRTSCCPSSSPASSSAVPGRCCRPPAAPSTA